MAASQRTRLLEAVGRAVAEKGYAAATIDDIVRDAGVSKKTFYEHFSDKLDCFLAAYEAASDQLLEHVRAAQEAAEDDWLARTRAGIHAYLRWLAAEPALARVFLIEIAAAGPVALELRERMRDRYADRMRELADGGRRARRDLPRRGGRRGRPGRATSARGRGPARARAGPPLSAGVAAVLAGEQRDHSPT